MKPATSLAPHVAAFFDLDGTLIGPPSLERRFLRYLRWRGALTVARGARWLGRFLREIWRGLDEPPDADGVAWYAATAGNKAHLAGIRVATMNAFLTALGRSGLAFFPDALQRLEWHAAQGHRVFLVSGTLAPLADAVARRLPVSVVPCATQLEAVEGGCTGDVAGEAVCGPGKVRAVEQLAAQYGLDLSQSYAYGNSWSDRWMLERVGHPAAVNPSGRLARLARRRGWPVLLWRQAERHRGAEILSQRGEKGPASGNTSLTAAGIRFAGERRK